jgi:putative transposase
MGLRGRNNLIEEHFFFVTTTVLNFNKVFIRDTYCNILINNIRYYQERYKFEILAYCIMPSHFHWILKTDSLKGNVSSIMRDIKKYSSWDIMERLGKDESPLLSDFINVKTEGQKRQFWMHRFDDEAIRDEKMLWTKIKYIHNNPVEAGIVNNPEDYKYSSAKNYILNDQSVIYVEKCWAGIEMK